MRSAPDLAERREIAQVAAGLARRELAPHALDLDRRLPGALEAAWSRVAEVGFNRALLAPEHGGAGLDAGSLLPCLEELAAGEAGVATLVLLANAALAAMPAELAAGVGEDERWSLVPAPPEQLATSARIGVMEAGDGEAVVSGALFPALGALGADGIVVVALQPDPVVAALRAGAPGLEVRPCEPQLGLRSALAARVSLSGVAAEPDTAAAEPPAAECLALLRAGAAAIARGLARRAEELALSYARTRFQGGVAIVEHDAVRQMLSAMAVRRRAAAPCGAALDDAAALPAKVAATEAALATATDAVQVFGGSGYMLDTGVEKLMRDAKSLQLWPEPNWMAADAIVDLDPSRPEPVAGAPGR